MRSPPGLWPRMTRNGCTRWPALITIRPWKRGSGPWLARTVRLKARAFLRGSVEGVPLFGSNTSTDGSTYAAISLEKLRYFRPGLVDLHEQIAYRVGRQPEPSDDDQAAVEFSREFCEWIDEIVDGGRDLWFDFGC